MIVKFLPTRNGGGLGSVNYLLNERQEQGTARILKGNEAQTRAIISQMPYKQKTCFGVLSFSEQANSISDETKLEIMRDFERTLLGDHMKDRVNILWVEHSDKNGRLELNFLIPKIDLVSGKSFNPYFAKIDQFNIDLWKRTINDEYGFTQPNDPSRQSNIAIDKKDLAHYNTITELDKTLKELVAQGAIKNRSNLIDLLEANGYKVTRQNKSGISITLPNQKRSNRMKGGIYDEQFTDFDRLGELGESQSRQIQRYANRDTQTECKYNRRRISENIQRRDKRNKERYKETSINGNLRAYTSQKKDINRDKASYNRKIVAWHNNGDLNYRATSRIFYQLQILQQPNSQLSSTHHHTTREKRLFREMANTAEYERELSRQGNPTRAESINHQSKRNEADKRRDIVSLLKQSGALINDTIRNRIIERARNITTRNSEIARRDREQAEREQRAKRELRELAERENNSVLRRLSQQFQERVREYLISTQERIRKLRERTRADQDYQERIKSNFKGWRERLLNSGLPQIREQLQDFASRLRLTRSRIRSNQADVKRELGRYADVVSRSIQRTKSEAIRRNGGEFRECLEREIERTATNGGYGIEKELRSPERQRLLKLKRQRERERNRSFMRMR